MPVATSSYSGGRGRRLRGAVVRPQGPGAQRSGSPHPGTGDGTDSRRRRARGPNRAHAGGGRGAGRGAYDARRGGGGLSRPSGRVGGVEAALAGRIVLADEEARGLDEIRRELAEREIPLPRPSASGGPWTPKSIPCGRHRGELEGRQNVGPTNSAGALRSRIEEARVLRRRSCAMPARARR